MTTTPDLFAPRAAEPPAPRPAAPRAGVSLPATPGDDICCRCAGRGCYGLGDQWFCAACVPGDFLPRGRGL